MDADSGTNTTQQLAQRFAQLWEDNTSSPDVFAFLSSHPNVSDADRLGVLLIDQEQRWRRGQAFPLRIYLSAFPKIAAQGEMVRALVDGERRERWKRSGRLAETMSMPTAERISEAPTQPLDVEAVAADTEVDRLPRVAEEPPTGPHPMPEDGTPSTSQQSSVTQTEERLSFSVDENYHLETEAEAVRAILDTVRFTLVRRIGAGGMGMVYEAYDQQRGELVALKTMRQVDPLALVRFKQEFRSLSDISHPNLVNLYELFAVEDRWFFTMELVEGYDFVSFVRSRADPSSLRGTAGAAPGAISQGGDAIRRDAKNLFDEPRLRDALRQLAEGVGALHQAGKLHRDIKPTNVLVTLDGHLLLLDFGLAIDLEVRGRGRNVDRQVVGTVGHMSPEQARGLPVTPASDWYSVGVMLFEAMTGQLPFVGRRDDVIAAKVSEPAPSPNELVEGLPHDLVSLCCRLLERDSRKRPTGREILEQLSGSSCGPVGVVEPYRPIHLIGRAPQRRVLAGVFKALNRGKPQSVFVLGRTGMGKTTLIRSFLDELIEKDDAIVLDGRCYERESVPYKALDSLIDALARYLKGLGAGRAESLLPDDVGFLARLFPVLKSVEAVARAQRGATEMPDRQELRRRAVAGLRELLKRLGEKRPLILAIDDLQWGDVDSAILLSDALCSAPSPLLLFIGCFRSEDAEQSAFLRELRRCIAKGGGGSDHRELAVEPLPQADAREMALALLGREDSVSLAQAHLVARESGGNPLFIDELVKHIQSGAPTEHWAEIGQLDLDEVLWARIGRQPEEARRLLAVVAVSGRPIPQALAFQASELGPGSRVALASLRSARLIRCIGQSQRDDVETYHDRIRETVTAHLPPDVVRWHHERLALVLSTSGPVDPEILAAHYRGAGDAGRACDYYARGADQAAAALAFDHAARLFRTALELHRGSDGEAGVLSKKLGDALANAGRGAEAASAYLKAAESATAAETLELKRRASTQLLISGHVDEGLALLRTLLGPLGLSMPDTPRQARRSLIWHRALLRLRGLGFQNRDESQIAAIDLTRIDLCWSAVAGLSMSEPIRGADFQTRGLLLALRAGEPLRIARALAMEAGHRATAGTAAGPRVASLLKAADDIAQRNDSPYARGMVEMIRGFSSLMLGEWRSAQTHLDEAELVFRNQCTGVAWERDTVHNFVLWALVQMGDIPELKRRWSGLLREARERGDLYAAAMLTTFYMTLVKLASNESLDSETELQAALDHRRDRRFNLQHSSALESLIHLYLYRGDLRPAWARLDAIWPEYERSMLLGIQMVRINMLELRARVALSIAEKVNDNEIYLRQAKSDARRLEREGPQWALGHAHYVRAGIAACSEDVNRAVEELTLATNQYDAAGMPLRAQILRARLAEVQTNPSSRALRSQVEQWITGQGIVSPARWFGMFAPGFAKISSESMETTY
jgi:serine/threonine protein kinase